MWFLIMSHFDILLHSVLWWPQTVEQLARDGLTQYIGTADLSESQLRQLHSWAEVSGYGKTNLNS